MLLTSLTSESTQSDIGGLPQVTEELSSGENNYIQEGEPPQAVEAYDIANEATSTGAEVFCTQASDALKDKRFEDAMTHLKKALELEPGKAAAHAFMGMAYHGLDNLPSAFSSLETAVKLASCAEEQRIFGNIRDRMYWDAGLPSFKIVFDAEAQYLLPLTRLAELQAKGHTFRIDSALVRGAYAQSRVLKAWDSLRQLEPVPAKSPQHPNIGNLVNLKWIPGELTELLDGAILDPGMGFVYESGDALFPDPLRLLVQQFEIEQGRLSSPPRESTPDVLIAHASKILADVGWEGTSDKRGARAVLESAIAVEFMDGWGLDVVLGDARAALFAYSKALAIILEALKKWSVYKLGRYFQPAFVRVVRSRIMLSRVTQCLSDPSTKESEDVVEIERLAYQILKSCEDSPWPVPTTTTDLDAVVKWVAFQKVPTADGRFGLGFIVYSHAHPGEPCSQQGGHTYLDARLGETALTHFLAAAAWYPEGDLKRVGAIFHAALTVTQIDGISLEILDILIEAVKQNLKQCQMTGVPDKFAEDTLTNLSREVVTIRDRMAYLGRKKRIADPAKILLRAQPLGLQSQRKIKDAVRIRKSAVGGPGVSDRTLNLLRAWKEASHRLDV